MNVPVALRFLGNDCSPATFLMRNGRSPPNVNPTMLAKLDRLLTCGIAPSAKRNAQVRRIDGNRSSRVLYFLPWQTPFEVALRSGMIPLEFLACYEMPETIVSPVPELCAVTMMRIVDDARGVIDRVGLAPERALIVGFSMGTFPATYLANEVRARLVSVCSAPRGDDVVWESPAASAVKREAMAHGYSRADFTAALSGLNPVDNLDGLSPCSSFVVARNDPVVPLRRTEEWIESVRACLPESAIHIATTGHIGTILASRRHQLRVAQDLD